MMVGDSKSQARGGRCNGKVGASCDALLFAVAPAS